MKPGVVDYLRHYVLEATPARGATPTQMTHMRTAPGATPTQMTTATAEDFTASEHGGGVDADAEDVVAPSTPNEG